MLFSVEQGSPPLGCCFCCLVLVWYAFLISFRFNFGWTSWSPGLKVGLSTLTLPCQKPRDGKGQRHLPCFFLGRKNRGKLVGLGARERSIEVILIFRNVHIQVNKKKHHKEHVDRHSTCRNLQTMVFAICSSPIWIVHEWRICWHTQKQTRHRQT